MGLNEPEAFVWFVGDGGSNELAGAKQAGLTTVMTHQWIPSLADEKRRQRASHSVYQINQLNELLDLLN